MFLSWCIPVTTFFASLLKSSPDPRFLMDSWVVYVYDTTKQQKLLSKLTIMNNIFKLAACIFSVVITYSDSFTRRSILRKCDRKKNHRYWTTIHSISDERLREAFTTTRIDYSQNNQNWSTDDYLRLLHAKETVINNSMTSASLDHNETTQNFFCRLSKTQCIDTYDLWNEFYTQYDRYKLHYPNHLRGNTEALYGDITSQPNDEYIYIGWISVIQGQRIGIQCIASLLLCSDTKSVYIDAIYFHPFYSRFRLKSSLLKQYIRNTAGLYDYKLKMKSYCDNVNEVYRDWITEKRTGVNSDV